MSENKNMISDEAVEAAKEATREVTPPPGVSKADWLAEHGSFALIAGAIAAAAPHMTERAYNAGHLDGMTGAPNNNPYRSQT